MQRAALFSGGDAQMAAGDLGELLVPYMPTIRVPKSGDRVYKTECAFSYDSPVSAAKPPRLPSLPLPSGARPALSRRSTGNPPLPRPALHRIPVGEHPVSVSPVVAASSTDFIISPVPSVTSPPASTCRGLFRSQASFRFTPTPRQAAGLTPPRVGIAAGRGPALPRPVPAGCCTRAPLGTSLPARTPWSCLFVYFPFSLRRSEVVA